MLVEAALFLVGLTALVPSLVHMLAVSLVVLGLFHWHEGIDRRAAVVCLL